MSYRPGNNFAYGLNNALQALAPLPIIAQRAPNSSDVAEIGTQWIYNNMVYQLTSGGTWTELSSTGGSGDFDALNVQTTANTAGIITLDTNGGTSETIVIRNQQGTSADAIGFLSVAGGITIDAGQTLLLTSVANTASAINMVTNTGTTETITITNTQGTNAAAVAITATAGGVKLQGVSGAVNVVSNKTSGSATFTAVNNALVGTSAFTGNTVAQNATQAITITNSNITATNGVMVTVSNNNVSGNAALMQIQGITQAAGSMVITTKNIGGASGLGATDSVVVSFMVLG